MTSPLDTGTTQQVRDARIPRPYMARLAAVFANPGFVLTLGAFCLGAAILAATEAVITEDGVKAKRGVEKQVETLSRSLRDQVDAEMDAFESLLRMAGAGAQRGDLEVAAARMARMVAVRSGKSAYFFLLDAQGGKVWENRSVSLDPEAVAEHLAAHRREVRMAHITPARRHPEPVGWAAYMSYPVFNREGGLAGLAMAVFNVAPFERSYGEMNLGGGGMLQVLRNDGTVIVRIASDGITAGQQVGDDEPIRSGPGSGGGCGTGIMALRSDGVERIGSFCGIDGYSLLVGVSVSAADALAGLRVTVLRYRIVAILLVALLTGGTLVMLTLLSRQQRTQNALRDSESRFRALNALGSDWYWETDAEYRLTHLSDGFSRMSGCPAAEVIGRPCWGNAFMTPVGSDWTAHKAVVARRTPFRDLALRYVSPQGVAAYGSISGEPVIGKDGALQGYRGVGNDITAEFVLRQRLRMQHDVTRILSQERNAGQAILAVIETICRTMEWSWGAHRRLDPETMLLTCHEYWLAPDIHADAFVASAREPKKGDPEKGTVSRAIMRSEIIWFTDHEPSHLRRSKLAREAGLRGAVAVPIRRSRGAGDALEFFSGRVEAPDQIMLDTLDAIGRELGQFMDRSEAQETSTHLERQRRVLLERLELQLEQMPVACLLQDRDFRLVYCNPAAERIFGYTSDELRGLDVATLIAPEAAREQIWDWRARLQAGDLNVRGTSENVRKGGARIIAEWSNTPLTDEYGQFAGVLATAQDVTERVKMVAALEESEERYRRIFEAAPLPMWVAESHSPRFLAVNDAAIAKYGYSREEFEQMTAIDLQVEEDRTFVARQLLGQDPTQPMQFQRRHVTKDGQTMVVEVTAQPFQFGGRPARLILVQDITERRLAQQALEDSEARFRAMFEQAAVGIAIRELSDSPRFLRVNPKLCEILGYSQAELLEKTTTALTADDDLETTQQINRRLMDGTLSNYSRRKRYKRKDGKTIWVNLSVSRLDEGRGGAKVGYLISVIQDITEQVESEAQVLESEARYRQIFAVTPLPMYLRDEDTLDFIDVNDACLAMFGYTREEMLAMTIIDIQTPAERERYRRGVGPRRARIVERLQKQYARKNGELLDVEIYSYPTTLGGRKIRLVLIRDMTEQMRAERLLRDSERRVALALEGSAGALFDWNVATGAVYLSERWNVMLGGEARETHTTFTALESLVHPDDHAGQHAAIVGLLKGATAYQQAEFRVKTHSGSWVWVECRGSVTEHDGQGRALRVLGTNIDVTQRKHAELALHERDALLRESAAEIHKLNIELELRVERRTRALAAANRELESFSYSVSHDLRAPLRTIDGFSQILLDEYAARLDATARGYLERVRAGSQRMAKLIDDLLELARVTRRDLQIRQCDLSALARDVARDLGAAEPARRVRIEIADGMVVAADSGLLRIALDNLLRNAWKFTSLQADAVIEVGFAAAEGGNTYFVRDNGVGFDMAYVSKLFGAFQRLHSEAEFQGTGIGLALVQRVIRRHGGEVWAEAVPGRGATFYFTLPEQSAGAEDMMVNVTAAT